MLALISLLSLPIVVSKQVVIFPDSQQSLYIKSKPRSSIEFPGSTRRREEGGRSKVGGESRLGLYLRTGHHEYRLAGGLSPRRGGSRINFPGAATRG